MPGDESDIGFGLVVGGPPFSESIGIADSELVALGGGVVIVCECPFTV